MKKSSVIVVVVVLAVLVAVGAIIAGGKKDKTSNMGDMSNMPTSQSDTSSSASTNTSDAVATNTVVIANSAYRPATITVKVGTAVTWTNQDSVQHDVISDDGKMESGPLLSKGETYKFSFTKAGTYKYHCSLHSFMHGTVIVTE